ncbi:decaprenyl-diphosphate synthase subunit 2 isoform X2 [Contarinia nasturtii]|uniref:decaprenyl-diphosphate synthase subunit 2 isoform X2 n=1 Tax=Contarinia nasturtii TaxID=265458 RepID=UPI0012D3D06C|nr:decaprenyl-diphosphate synthase subunit 2 isoform X2 [Contarinia nasturtii]
MSFYRLKYLWPKNSSKATSIVNGLRCMQTSTTTSNQLPARNVVSVHNRHHHTLLQRNLASNAQQIHNDQQCCSYASTSGSNLEKVATKALPKHDWDRAVSEAEKIVGYPTSFLSLRWLLSDEVANVALHLRKLVGNNHPLLKTAKNLLYHGRNNMQAWGLIVLLISKAAGQAPGIPETEHDKSAGVLHSQRALAEVCEMIRISHLVHQGLVNLQPLTQAGQDLSLHSDMTFGNKIALLSGDYLLGNSCAELAGLRNQDLVELISSAVRDLTEAEFIGDRDEQNNPLPSAPPKTPRRITTDVHDDYDLHLADDVLKPMEKERFMGAPDTEWALRNILSAGSLLGKSCQGALKLAGLSESTQKLGFHFGKHLVLSWQACLDLEPFLQPTLPDGTTFSLVSAPVLYHLEYNPNAYELIKKGYVSVENVDFKTLHSEIVKGPGVDKTQNLQRQHSQAAMNVLKKFPPSDARTALENILHAMQDLQR